MRIGLSYSRISGPTDERTASLISQEEAIVALLESRGFVVPPEYRFREQWSGLESIYERKVLIRCRELASTGKVAAFGVYDTDRLCRDPDQLTLVCGDNAIHGVETIFVRLDHETRSRIGRAVLYIKGLASALEADAIRDRTDRGRMKRFEAGIHAGYGRPRYGYRWDREHRRHSIDAVTSPILIRLFEEVAAGTPPPEVCRRLVADGIPTPFGKSVWTTSTLRVLIRERTYYGHVVGRRTMSSGVKREDGTVRQVPRPEAHRLVLDNHDFEPLVDRDLWEAANAALERAAIGPRKGRGQVAAQFLLAGILRCYCGFRMSQEFRRHRNGKSRCYRCTGGSAARANGNGCRATLGAAKLEAIVWDRVCRFLADDDAIERQIARLKDDTSSDLIRRDLRSSESRRKKIDADARKLIDAELKGGPEIMIDALRSKMAELEAESQRLDATIADLRSRLIPHAHLVARADSLADRIRAYRSHLGGSPDMAEKKKILTGLGISVVASKSEIMIQIDSSLACGNAENIPCNTPRLPTGRGMDINL